MKDCMCSMKKLSDNDVALEVFTPEGKAEQLLMFNAAAVMVMCIAKKLAESGYLCGHESCIAASIANAVLLMAESHEITTGKLVQTDTPAFDKTKH